MSNGIQQATVKTLFGAIMVHRSQQDFSCTQTFRFADPVFGFEFRDEPSSVEVNHIPAFYQFCIYSYHHELNTEISGQFFN
ncbi:hypothetical protein D3C87_1910290 [compost metagenome]